MPVLMNPLKDKLYATGLVLIAISLFFFSIPFFTHISGENAMALFIPNFVITVGYFLLLWANGRLKKGREGLFPIFLFLILFLISAYSLNREMVVFEDSVTWFAVLLVFLCCNYIAVAFFGSFPRWLQHLMVILLGTGMVIFLYLSMYLLPVYPYGLVLGLILGISLHCFVPVLFSIYTIVLMRRITAANHKYWWSFAGGAGTVVTLIVVFVIQWSNITHDINTTWRRATAGGSDGLPGWVAVSMQVQQGWITERALKSDLLYATASDDNGSDFWRMPSRNFGEVKKHDPLVVIATLFAGKPNLPEESRISILQSLYDSRHQGQERLWSGDHLWTEYVNTAVRIWPQFGVAFTEKTITVSNESTRGRWNNQEEAIYTFHMPEGAVVTALSLWIEGKEAKGILTTKAKADSAYKTIVGRERRDPSVVHWQEGNTVSVRVFPVIAGESRLFKLGITTPLIRREGKLVYENIYFDGPAVASATEEVQLDFQQAPASFIVPAVFSTRGKQSYHRKGKYKADWSIEMDEQPLSTDPFCFDGKIYTIRPYQKQRASMQVAAVYLDVNRSWTRAELDATLLLVNKWPVYVYHHQLVRLTDANKTELLEALLQQQFSLFPFFEIKDPSTALVISKSAGVSPNIDDLKETEFLKGLKKYLAGQTKTRLFTIGDQLSPYLKSLKEFRVFRYEHGTVEQLKELLTKQVFAMDIENDRQVVIDQAEVAIMQADGLANTAAPDHLMRLFAYNHIMQQTGTGLLSDQPVPDSLVEEAGKAYVVSPVSSLVVLETQQDYDRFNIKDNGNSLQNASLKSKGAVPEPHEWALITIAVLVVLTVKFQPVVKRKWS